MENTSVQFIALASGGRLHGCRDAAVSCVVIDSRSARPHAMFVAYVGPNRDGHDFIQQAYELGSRVFFISQAGRIPSILAYGSDVSVICVDHTEQDLVRFAQSYLAQFPLKRIALTGSVGKTTTKEMTAAVLSQKYRTVYTQGNLNTTLGQCLTAFQADKSTQAIVFEMGMDRKGEIESYCRWIRPHIAMITNVGTAHLEHLGTQEAIAHAKLEIATYLGPEDTLIVNSDSAYLSKAEVRNVMTGRFELLAVGTGCEADMALEEIRAQGLSVHFRLENKTNGEKQEVALSVPGRHNAWNAALAAACGIKLGVTLEQSAAALETVRQTERRLSVSEAAGVTLIDDTYNAGPDSMRAALTVLSDLQGKRRIAVLADILELGSMREEGHKSVGRAVACVAPDILLAVGENAAYYISGAQEAGFRGVSRLFRDSAQAFEWLKPKISAGDVILVKGSNATGVSKVACDIRTLIESEEDM